MGAGFSTIVIGFSFTLIVGLFCIGMGGSGSGKIFCSGVGFLSMIVSSNSGGAVACLRNETGRVDFSPFVFGMLTDFLSASARATGSFALPLGFRCL